jgi:hypothetical protein
MRKLSSEELTNGMFVQCKPSPAIYQILIKDGRFFYSLVGSNWIMNGDLVKDNWYETEETKYLNRDNKLKELGII